MSFRKLKTEYHIQCNMPGCGASLNTQVRASKVQAWGVAKTRGWLCRHTGSLWRHYCSKACYDAPKAPLDTASKADQDV
jgi:hypothetical protein